MEGFLRATRHQLVDEAGRPVRLLGVECGPGADFAALREQGYNVVRLRIDEPELDATIAAAAVAELRVVISRVHQPGGLWYSSEVSEDQWIDEWRTVAGRFVGNPTVIGADLHHRPGGAAAWFHANPARSWSDAARRCGNAVLAVNADWLIFVQGVETTPIDRKYTPGGNLSQAADHLVRLSHPEKLVHAAAESPRGGVHLARRWDEHWGFLTRAGHGPVVVVAESHGDAGWWAGLQAYLQRHGIGWMHA